MGPVLSNVLRWVNKNERRVWSGIVLGQDDKRSFKFEEDLNATGADLATPSSQ